MACQFLLVGSEVKPLIRLRPASYMADVISPLCAVIRVRADPFANLLMNRITPVKMG